MTTSLANYEGEITEAQIVRDTPQIPDYKWMTLDEIADDINMRVDRMDEDILCIGSALLAAREEFPSDEQFGKWREANTKLTNRATARRFMDTVTEWRQACASIGSTRIEPEAIKYLLRQYEDQLEPDVAAEVKDRVYTEARDGNVIDLARAKEIVAFHRTEKLVANLPTPRMQEVARDLVKRGITSAKKMMKTPEMVTAILEPLEPDQAATLEKIAEARGWDAEILTLAVNEITTVDQAIVDSASLLRGEREPIEVTEEGEPAVPWPVHDLYRKQAKAANPWELVSKLQSTSRILSRFPITDFDEYDDDLEYAGLSFWLGDHIAFCNSLLQRANGKVVQPHGDSAEKALSNFLQAYEKLSKFRPSDVPAHYKPERAPSILWDLKHAASLVEALILAFEIKIE